MSDTAAGEPTNSPAVIKSLARGFEVIKAFGPATPQMSLAEVARATGMTRASARRFLLTLEELGYVRLTGRDFSLTSRALETGNLYLSSLPFLRHVKPLLRELSEEVEESTGAAILDGSEIVVVSRLSHPRLVSVSLALGARFPAPATASGRLIMADTDDERVDAILEHTDPPTLTERTRIERDAIRDEITKAREQGWAAVDGEVELGLMTVAAPIVDPEGRVVAAINTATSASRGTLAAFLDRVLEPTLNTAQKISTDFASAYD